jgi:predicted nucleic acid-binding protein
MKIVVDANIVISAAIMPGKTREIITLANATFLAPPELEDEVRAKSPIIADKGNMSETDAEEVLDLLFATIGTVPYGIPQSDIQKARKAIGDEDLDDVPYLATAITVNATAVWSDDDVFEEQKYVEWYTTDDIVQLYEDNNL